MTSPEALQSSIDISGENEAPLEIVENIPCDFFYSFVRWQEKATHAAKAPFLPIAIWRPRLSGIGIK